MINVSGSHNPQSDAARFLVVTYSPTGDRIGVLLLYDGSLYCRMRDDWPESHVDYEYLMALGDGIKRDAAKVGGEPFFAFVLESFSNAITVTLTGETTCRDPLATLADLYNEHVGMLGVAAVTRALP